MRPFGATITLAEAVRIIDDAVRPIERVERVALPDALHRVLAQPAVAASDVPPFSRAAMDGYAIRAEDTRHATPERPVPLRRIERVFTGDVPTRAVDAGDCVEVATGAPLPGGADAVAHVEETRVDGERVLIRSAFATGQNVGRQGADIGRGSRVLQPGAAITPARLGVLAALGLSHVDVYARPRVAVMSTGNEIVPPGEPLGPGQIYDINRFTVAAIVQEHGGVAVPCRSPVDTLEALDAAIDTAAREDVIVFSGGTSVGERDLILDAIAARGEVLFHGISVKPGKPMAFGRIDGRLVFGLPGYPTSCLTNAYVLVAPALRRIARLPAAPRRVVHAPLNARIMSTPGRHQFYTVRLENGVAVPAFKASGDITSMSRADGYIEIPAGTDVVDAGTMVTITLF